MRVLAKAYGDRPLDRLVVGVAPKVVYIAAQSVANAMEPGEAGGVGFPKNTVFEFDAALFDSLSAAWEHRDAAELTRLWSRATPITVAVKEAA